MQQAEVQWSPEEKKIAQAALEGARDREIEAVIKSIRENAGLISQIEDVWQLHDYLSAKRHEIDGKYDDRESFLMFTLSRLIKDGLIDLVDLSGLEPEKQSKVKILTRM
ncbi:MAG: hypothetical protein DCF25_10615 [Leptolyngbya foveolarum]|uniref:Fluorescence recovery protein n=1 Tax=Leptolyngbya foveolarum TaxID=47253 RepID=A0A2W4UCK8_9CYAN|nr:MAG: hypothetical protein DCF25_10615 [Leptolyngbya foveolarum]